MNLMNKLDLDSVIFLIFLTYYINWISHNEITKPENGGIGEFLIKVHRI